MVSGGSLVTDLLLDMRLRVGLPSSDATDMDTSDDGELRDLVRCEPWSRSMGSGRPPRPLVLAASARGTRARLPR